MKIPNEIIDDYLKEIPPHYENEVFTKIIAQSYDKDKAEKAAIEFYRQKNNGVDPIIKWAENPVNLREMYPDKEVQIFSTYFNINWVYFFYTFMEYLEKNKDKIDPEIIDQYKETYKESKLAYDIFVNTFGVSELPRVVNGNEITYGEIILIKKPKNVNISDDKLHCLTKAAFEYPDNGPTFYYIEGVKMEEDLWMRTMLTGIMDEHSPLSDELVSEEKEELRQTLNNYETRIGQSIKPLSVEDIMSIDNSEQKSKVIKYVGYDKILEKANIMNECDVTTHKGEIIKYQLFEINLGLEVDNIPSRFVKVSCWSTGRVYVLAVDPRNKQCETAMGAIAWTCVKPDGTHCTEEEYAQLEHQT